MEDFRGCGPRIFVLPQWTVEKTRVCDNTLCRNRFVAGLCQELAPDRRTVVPLKPISTEDLHSLLRAHGLGEGDVWVYGSWAPAELLPRLNNKIQVHPPAGEESVPSWYDREFAHRIRPATLPGYSCFGTAAFEVACQELLDRYVSIRIKDPSQNSGAGQTVVASAGDLAALREGYRRRSGVEFAAALHEHGLVVEANLIDADTWGVCVTHTPVGDFTTLGRNVTQEVELPDGRREHRYAGMSGVVVRGGLEQLASIPDEGVSISDPVRGETYAIHTRRSVLAVARHYFSALSAWHRQGLTGSRISLDIVCGCLQRRGGRTTTTRVVEETQRAGGGSPLDLCGILRLHTTPDAAYAVRSARIAFTRKTAQAYEKHMTAVEHGVVLWNGFDASEGRHVLQGMY